MFLKRRKSKAKKGKANKGRVNCFREVFKKLEKEYRHKVFQG